LCGDSCQDVAVEKMDMLTLSPFHEEEGTTCLELAMDLLDGAEEGDETCESVRANYQRACCSEEFGEFCFFLLWKLFEFQPNTRFSS